MSVYGQSTDVVTNQPSINLNLNVDTDYILITVNNDYTSNVTLTHKNLSINMNSKNRYNYGYVLNGTTSSTISLIDANGDSYFEELGLYRVVNIININWITQL